MGIIRRSFNPVVESVKAVTEGALERRYLRRVDQQDPNTTTARASVPLNPGLAPLPPQQPYEVFAREGYTQNDIVYAAITALGTSAAEPLMAAYTGIGDEEEKLDKHPILTLLRRPNRWLSYYQLIYTIILYRSIAGNVFLEKVRSAAGNVVELWPLRPDRVHILADPDKFIAGYRYQIGGHWWDIPPEDIIHLRTPNPLNDYYGMPPLMPIAGRVDIDNWSRAFIAAFFRNGGVPAGLLTLKRPLQEGERELIQARFRGDYGGPAGWHNLAIIDLEGAEAEFQPAGMPLGDRGLVFPDLNFISEARIAGAFGVPLSMIGSVLGMRSSSYANRVSDRESFWHETLSPLYQEIGDGLTMGLVSEFMGIDRVGFDLSTVLALRPEDNALHERLREDYKAGVISLEECRDGIGADQKINPKDTFLISTTFSPARGKELMTIADEVNQDPEQAMTAGGSNGFGFSQGSGAGGVRNGGGNGSQPNMPAKPSESREPNRGMSMKDWTLEVETKATHSGMMICCYVDMPDLPFDPAEGGLGKEIIHQSDRHITLAYVPDPTPDQIKAAQDCAQMVADHLPIPGQISGVGRFAGEFSDPFIALVDSPFLHELRNELVQHLQRAEVPVSTEHAFMPHVTLAYLGPEDPTPIGGGLSGPIPFLLDNVSVKAGDAPATRYQQGETPYVPAGRTVAPNAAKKRGARTNGEAKEWQPATRW